MRILTKRVNSSYYRNFIFGIEDSLVSTVGVLFGLATAFTDKATILISGLIIIAVESISMGAGAYLSEESEQEIDENTFHKSNPIVGGIVMFFSYFFAGFIPLLPYLFADVRLAKSLSVLFGLTFLFIVGYIPTKSVRSALRMVIITGFAILAGYLLGKFHSTSDII